MMKLLNPLQKSEYILRLLGSTSEGYENEPNLTAVGDLNC